MELKMHFHIVVTLQVFDFFLFPNCHCFSCWPHIFGYLQYKIYIPKHLIGFSNLVNSAWKNLEKFPVNGTRWSTFQLVQLSLIVLYLYHCEFSFGKLGFRTLNLLKVFTVMVNSLSFFHIGWMLQNICWL